MSTVTMTSVAEYLATSFEGPEPDYIDGEIRERGMPTFEHARSQARVIGALTPVAAQTGIELGGDCRVIVAPGRYRVIDVVLFLGIQPSVPTEPALAVIEILSPDDRYRDLFEKLEDYRVWGVPHIWVLDPIHRRMLVFDQGLREVKAFSIPDHGIEITAEQVFG